MSKRRLSGSLSLMLIGGLAAGVVGSGAFETASAQVQASSLSARLEQAVRTTEGASSGLSSQDAQASIENALETAIAISGVGPAEAIDSLVAARTNLRTAQALSATGEAAIQAVLDRIRQALAGEFGPAATGGPGGAAPLAAPPVGGSGGGGGSDYRP